MRVLVLAAIALLAVVAPTTSSAAPCAGFTDVEDTDPFCSEVTWLKNRGITLGCTVSLYCPHEPVSRLQMAAFLNRLGARTAGPVLVDGQGKVAGIGSTHHNGVLYRGQNGLAELAVGVTVHGRPSGLLSAIQVGNRAYYAYEDTTCTGQSYYRVDITGNVSSQLRYSGVGLKHGEQLYFYAIPPGATPSPLQPAFLGGQWQLRVWDSTYLCTAFGGNQPEWLYVPVVRMENISAMFSPPFHWE